MARSNVLTNIVAASAIALSLANLLPQPALADVIFDFTFTDGSDVPGSGKFFDPLTADGSANAAVLFGVASELGSLLAHSALIEIDVSAVPDSESSTLAKAGGFFYVDPMASGVILNAIQAEIIDGAFTPGTPDGFMMINSAKSFYNGMDPGGIGPTENDLASAILHELTHALGWASTLKPDGTSALTDAFIDGAPGGEFDDLGELYTVYDSLLIGFGTGGPPDVPILTAAGELNPLITPPLSGVLYSGPEGVAVAGGLVPLTVTPFGLDSTHIPSALSLDTVMNPGLPDGVIKRDYTPFDLAVLSDLGYSFTTIPEPGNFAGLLVFVAASVRRRIR